MNWLIGHLLKEARGRRFESDDRVRYFTEKRKGKGKGVVLSPSFNKGTVVDFDRDSRRYKVKNDRDEILDIHPRNIVPDSVSRQTPVNIPRIPEIPSESVEIPSLEVVPPML